MGNTQLSPSKGSPLATPRLGDAAHLRTTSSRSRLPGCVTTVKSGSDREAAARLRVCRHLRTAHHGN